jgi:hypothetical protein
MTTVNENLRAGDLRYSIIKQISVDQFEPKTGEIEDVVVIGFYAINQRAGYDLYNFLNGTYLNFRDIEVSQNPNADNRYMVFVEVNRSPDVVDQVKALVAEVERLSGRLAWKITVGHNPTVRYRTSNWAEQVIATATKYESPEGVGLSASREADRIAERVKTFFQRSDLTGCQLDENVLTLTGRNGTVKLQFAGIGTNQGLLRQLGLTESAINQNFDPHLLKQLNIMLGSVRAEALDNHLILYREGSSIVLAAQPL